jgi:hypothetical protein
MFDQQEVCKYDLLCTFFTNDHSILFGHQVEAASKYSTVDTLKQVFYFVPADYKVRFYFLSILPCYYCCTSIWFHSIWIMPLTLCCIPIYLCCNNTTFLWFLCHPFFVITLYILLCFHSWCILTSILCIAPYYIIPCESCVQLCSWGWTYIST